MFGIGGVYFGHLVEISCKARRARSTLQTLPSPLLSTISPTVVPLDEPARDGGERGRGEVDSPVSAVH